MHQPFTIVTLAAGRTLIFASLSMISGLACAPTAPSGALAHTSKTASGKTITVCVTGCDYTSINAAIDAATNGDVIQLAAETYSESAVIDTDGKAITLRGADDQGSSPTSILDGGGAHRVLQCRKGETSTTVFENLVIQNGYAAGDDGTGGGMYNYKSSPNLTDCTFTSNSAVFSGGGMFNIGSDPILTDCTFTDNTTDQRGGGMANYKSSPTLFDCSFTSNSARDGGGGLYNFVESSPTLTRCAFTSNTACIGGGMYSWQGSPALTDCAFTNNSADQNGGGMLHEDSNPALTGCTFTSNSASDGGGMSSWQSSPALTKCTFTSNSADKNGGGMSSWQSSPALTDCTFTSNSADRGGGMYNFVESSPTLSRCLFIDNSAGEGGGMYNQKSNPTLSHCNFCGNTDGSGFNSISGDAIDGSSSENVILDAECVHGDINVDGEMNGADFAYILGYWGLRLAA